MSTINNPLIKSSVFQSGSNQGNDSFLSMENGDFDINQFLNKNRFQSPNLTNNNNPASTFEQLVLSTLFVRIHTGFQRLDGMQKIEEIKKRIFLILVICCCAMTVYR